jgi:tRNA uridine 5-carboxymethylaminomethyl modification enzyme
MRQRTLQPVLVVGGGHAGVEAAHAAARMGADVLLVTLDPDALVRLSCNPAIGGIGKAHLVREIDALGGVMAAAADEAGIHFRLLNRRRGPAVRGPRVQQDQALYPAAVTEAVQRQGQIELVPGEAAALRLEEGRLAGLELADGRLLRCSAAVVTTGTFLRGRMYRGEAETAGGRVGEAASEGLARALEERGVRLGRLKTGTPPRLERASLDLERFEAQPGDDRPEPLSFAHLDGRFTPPLPQTITHLAHTGPRAHAVVRAGLHRSPLYTGRVGVPGPRYCPSFEDKVVKFADKPSHLLHLEPMGLGHPWIYVNGLSTSLPEELQEELVRSIEGLEGARIARFGYAVAYDFVPPTQLRPTLELRVLPGLFLAGQICGTTGYEEAAGLGLVAGANAALSAIGAEAWIPGRRESYLGVMVDDLTNSGVVEPYRMFTARAEARLTLSPDSADRRLADVGARLGLISADARARVRERWDRIEALRCALERSGAERLRRGEAAAAVVDPLPEARELGPHERDTAVALVRYAGYLDRERREVRRLERAEQVRVPEGFCFASLPGLSHEVRQRLSEVRPRSLGQAARIPGVTPAAVALLAATLGRLAAGS